MKPPGSQSGADKDKEKVDSSGDKDCSDGKSSGLPASKIVAITVGGVIAAIFVIFVIVVCVLCHDEIKGKLKDCLPCLQPAQ